MQSISYSAFCRKKFLKILRSRFDRYIVICKLIKTKNDKIARLNYERIINTINFSVQNKNTFESNNIYYIFQLLESYRNFISVFSDSIKNLNDIDALKDIQIAFFTKQAEFEKLLKENLEKPFHVDLTNTPTSEPTE